MYKTQLYRSTGDGALSPVDRGSLHLEEHLEDWIERDPTIVGERLAILGRQVRTAYGKFVDLLAIDSSGSLCIIELKKDKTPRDVIAQALDYASWCSELDSEMLEQIAFEGYNESLSSRYRSTFGTPAPPTIGSSRRIIIVGTELDATSTRIAKYLATYHDLDITVRTFNVFAHDDERLITFTSLVEPIDSDAATAARRGPRSERNPWTGYWYVNVGWQPLGYEDGTNRSWEDNVRYSFVSAGRSAKSVREIMNLSDGAPIYAYLNKHGYVGFGEVVGEPVEAKKLRLQDGRLLTEVDLHERSVIEYKTDDDALKEYAVNIKWQKTVDSRHAYKFRGIFANQKAACRLTEPNTLEFLARELGTIIPSGARN